MITPLQIVVVRIGGHVFEAHQSQICIFFGLQDQPLVQGVIPLSGGVQRFLKDEEEFKHWFLWHWRKTLFGRLLAWPSEAKAPQNLVLLLNHKNFWITDTRNGKSQRVEWDGDWPLGNDVWAESEAELRAWTLAQWPLTLEIALQNFVSDGRISPAQIEWKSGSWEELMRLFEWLLALQPSLFEGEPLEIIVRCGEQPTFELRKGARWNHKSPLTRHFKLWRVLPRLFLKWNHPFGERSTTLRFLPSPPTFHEQLEAKPLLREWLHDKMLPDDIEELLPQEAH